MARDRSRRALHLGGVGGLRSAGPRATTGRQRGRGVADGRLDAAGLEVRTREIGDLGIRHPQVGCLEEMNCQWRCHLPRHGHHRFGRGEEGDQGRDDGMSRFRQDW
jgi:hypothetical protein